MNFYERLNEDTMLMNFKFVFGSLTELSRLGEYMHCYSPLHGFATRQLLDKLRIVPATVLGYEHS